LEARAALKHLSWCLHKSFHIECVREEVSSRRFSTLPVEFRVRVRVRDNRRVLKSEAPNLYVIWLFNS